MDQIEEVKKYKTLLDQGAISQEEFDILKQKALGLQTKEDKAKALEEAGREAKAELERIRKEKFLAEQKKAQEEKLAKQKEEERQHAEELKRQKEEAEAYLEQKKQAYDEAYRVEKAKEDARNAARQELIDKEKEAERAKKSTVKYKVLLIVSWLFTIFFAFFALFGIPIGYPLLAVVSIFLFAMICPPISDILKAKIPIFSKYKTFFVVIFVALWLASFLII